VCNASRERALQFVDPPGCIFKVRADVFGLEVRVQRKNLGVSETRSDESNYGADRHPLAPNAGSPAHDGWIHGDTFEVGQFWLLEE
jgi:hypothetical protein